MFLQEGPQAPPLAHTQRVLLAREVATAAGCQPLAEAPEEGLGD